MAIAGSCYLRNINKKDQNLLKKAGRKFGLNTTPSILMHILTEHFDDAEIIKAQSDKIKELKDELQIVKGQFKDFKNQVHEVFSKEEELKNQRAKVLKAI